ncbi:sporulation protein [Lentibacillus sp. CBA3610]|uniref:sporulation protein n=1 Tax=Lentibacillus sp. CBA3610 TaxID=2518176 RepID=UPI001595E5B9|nr:sporulation protein [Lentibacillus sp. CBA3610]QKY71556.1 sporulation protein [Lentibacillus sp. CBA3610]
MDNTLSYLRESLVNHQENDMTKQIADKLERNGYKNEEEFVRNLNEEEMEYLDQVVKKELNYARNAEDEVRAGQLREIYELLF